MANTNYFTSICSNDIRALTLNSHLWKWLFIRFNRSPDFPTSFVEKKKLKGKKKDEHIASL